MEAQGWVGHPIQCRRLQQDRNRFSLPQVRVPSGLSFPADLTANCSAGHNVPAATTDAPGPGRRKEYSPFRAHLLESARSCTTYAG